MRSCHNLSAGFDDPNLVSCAGLVPVMTLAERAGLHDLARAHVRVPGSAGSNADVKVTALVAGMVAGADTIDAMDLLRHGGMGRMLTAGRAPSTLGTFLRSFTFGHVRQLDAVASRVLVNLAERPPLLAGADQVAYLDIDDTIKATYGYQKQGAGYGYSKVKGLNALLATCSTPLSAPVIAATRLRRGPTNFAKGAARLVADALVTAAKAGATGQVTVRSDSAYYKPRRDRRRAHRWGPVLHHRPDGSRREQGDHPDPRRRVGAHQVPPRDLRPGRTVLGLRRAGRRDHLHRVHLPPPLRAHRCPVDRAPRQGTEPGHGPGRAGRPVRHLAPPRRLHRLRRGDARRRGHPPRSRDRG